MNDSITASLIIVVLSLTMLVALAGLIYPFKPFKKRSNALLVFIFSFVVIWFNVPNSNETATKPNTIEANPVASAAKPDAPIVQAQAIAPIAVPADLRINILTSISKADWIQARRLIRIAERNYYTLPSLMVDIEKAALAVVKPLPSSKFAANEAGYRFLAQFIPENLQYLKKADSYGQKRRDAEERAKKKAVSRLKVKTDKVEGVTWYHHRNSPKYTNSRSTVYLYIGKSEYGKPWIRMRAQYAARDWLFVESVEAWHDGVKERLVTGGFETDNHSSIWEWTDVKPTPRQLSILRSLGTAKESILRFSGSQYRKDVTLSNGDKRALREILLAYEVMSD